MKVKPEYKGFKIFLQKQRLTLHADLIPEKYLPLVLKAYPHIFEEEVIKTKKEKKNVISFNDTEQSDLSDTTNNN